MAFNTLPFQALTFKSLADRTINTGTNLITNGAFPTDLTSWTAVNMAFSSGTAAYTYSAGDYKGTIFQDTINLLADNRYRLRFRYKTSKAFTIKVSLLSMSTSNFDTLAEKTIAATADGKWHVVEYYINAKINSTQELLLQCLAPDEETTGFQFDDISLYAQQSVLSCGACDTVIMDRSRPLEFQVTGRERTGSNLYVNGDFATNPFSPITTTTLEFDIAGAVATGESFTLYLGAKIIIFKRGSALLSLNSGDLWVVSTGTGLASLFTEVVKSFMQDTMDGILGTVTTESSGTISIANVPAGSYLENNDGLLSAIDTIGSTAFTTTATNCYYNTAGKSMCMYNADLTGNTMVLQQDINLTSGKYYIIRIEWTSAFSDWQDEKITIDDGTSPPTEIPFNVVQTLNGKYFEAEYKALLTGAHSIEISIKDAEEPNYYQLCLDNITLYEIKLDDITIEVKDCAGDVTEVPYTMNPYGSNVLIQIDNNDFPAGSPFQIIIRDSQGDAVGMQHFSQSIELIDLDNPIGCKLDKLVKLNWTDTCNFGGIDYKNLPFTNEVWVRGYAERQPLDKKDRLQMTNTDGSLKTIFNHSLGKAELRIAPYGIDIHRILERAVEHGTFAINDMVHYLDDSGIYTVNTIGNGKFTARVELVESGSEVIKTSCCC